MVQVTRPTLNFYPYPKLFSDLGPNCLQRLSTDNTNRKIVNPKTFILHYRFPVSQSSCTKSLCRICDVPIPRRFVTKVIRTGCQVRERPNLVRARILYFWEGALGPFVLGNYQPFNQNWENFFNHAKIIFFYRGPKTTFNYSKPFTPHKHLWMPLKCMIF